MSYDNCKHNSFRHKDAVSDFIDNQSTTLSFHIVDNASYVTLGLVYGLTVHYIPLN
ncbi:14314_t:CDS:2 [Rhizophagus irregularis]|nr:14314_t:CDS:2 [Rhizophagus irregularis]